MSAPRRTGAGPAGLPLVMLIAVLLLVTLVLRPDTDLPEPAAGTGPVSDEVPTGPPPEADAADFCAAFLELAEAQISVQDAPAGSTDHPAVLGLRAAADDLVETGVPRTMTLVARSGYHTLIGGVYGSLELELTPAAVGAPPEPVEGGDAALAAFLAETCPA